MEPSLWDRIVDHLIRNQQEWLSGALTLFVGATAQLVIDHQSFLRAIAKHISKYLFPVEAQELFQEAREPPIVPKSTPLRGSSKGSRFGRVARIGLVAMTVGIGGWLIAKRFGIEPVKHSSLLEFPAVQSAGSEPSRKLLILFHGWRGDGSEHSLRYAELLREDPRFVAVDLLLVNYPTYMLRRNLRVPEFAQWLCAEFEARPEFAQYNHIGILAHSMGGLVARELCLAEHIAGKVRRCEVLVEVATPHLGANLAGLAAELGLSEDLTSDMRSGSSYLAGLAAHWNGFVARPTTLAIASRADGVVPFESATYQCDSFSPLSTWGHRELVRPSTRDDGRYVLATRPLGTYFQGASESETSME